MPQLQITLEEGFEGDTVRLKVDNRPVYGRDGVSTKMQVGVADVVETSVEGDTASIEIEVPSRAISESFVVDVSPTTHVGISVKNGEVVHRRSDSPFWHA